MSLQVQLDAEIDQWLAKTAARRDAGEVIDLRLLYQEAVTWFALPIDNPPDAKVHEMAALLAASLLRLLDQKTPLTDLPRDPEETA